MGWTGADRVRCRSVGRRRARRAGLVGAALLASAVFASARPVVAADDARGRDEGGPPDSYVAAWDAVGADAFTKAALTPAEGHILFAYVAIAVYDAVMAVDGGDEPFAVDLDAPDGASPQAAVAASARQVLWHYLPAQASFINDAYTTSLGTIPDGTAEEDGVAIGTEVAKRLIAERADDGFRAPVPYTWPVLGRAARATGARSFRSFVLERKLDIVDAARFMAMISVV